MHLHKRDHAVLKGNVQLELVYESNPYFAGEPICLLVKLKHLGSQHQREALGKKISTQEGKLKELTTAAGNDIEQKPWIAKTFWNTFHQEDKFKLEEVQEKIKSLKSKLQFHEPVDLMSCFLQIFGQCSLDDTVINTNSLETDQKSHTLAGVGSTLSTSDTGSTVSGLITSFFNTDIGDTSTKTAPVMSTEIIDTKNWIHIPFLLIPQTLLFSELVLKPGESKVFKFKTDNLSKDLPPSYSNSSHFNISYTVQVGISTYDPNDIPERHIYNFPILVQAFVDGNICQYEMPLNKKLTITPPGKVQDAENLGKKSVTSYTSQQTLSQDGDAKRQSISSVDSSRNPSASEMKKIFKNTVATWNEKEDTDLPIVSILDQQFGANSFNTVRENLTQLYLSELPEIKESPESENAKLYPQLNTIQTEYEIRMNDKLICNLELSKPFYSVSDQIDVTLHLQNDTNSEANSFKVTAVTACIETFELINPKFSIDQDIAKKKPTGTLVYETHSISFDNCKALSMKLLPQCSPSTLITSQFKTDIFQLKWMLTFKFVIVPLVENNDQIALEKSYEDKKGTAFHAKKDMEGYDFSFHIPLIVLPTEKQLGGW